MTTWKRRTETLFFIPGVDWALIVCTDSSCLWESKPTKVIEHSDIPRPSFSEISAMVTENLHDVWEDVSGHEMGTVAWK